MQLSLIFNETDAKKQEARLIQSQFKDSLEHNAKYGEIVSQIQRLRDEKKMIENEAWAESSKDAERLELLKLDLKSEQQKLSDVALEMYTKGQHVEVVDKNGVHWLPEFSVRFRKSNDQDSEDESEI